MFYKLKLQTKVNFKFHLSSLFEKHILKIGSLLIFVESGQFAIIPRDALYNKNE